MTFLRPLILLPLLLYQSFFLALGQLWANKLRAILTTIGIVIGVGSVSAVIAALTGLKTSVLTEFETFGTNKLFIFSKRPDRGPGRNLSREQIKLKPDELDDMLQHCPSITSFTRMSQFSRPISAGGHIDETSQIMGIEATWHEIENRPVIMGRPFSIVDDRQRRPVCLINTTARDRLLLDRDCTGQYVMVGDQRFQIIGVVEKRTQSVMFGGGEPPGEVFIPFRTAWQMQQPRAYMWAIAAARSPEVSSEARAEAIFYLRKQRKIPPDKPATVRVDAVEEFVQQFKRVSTAITLVAAGVVGISLVVGGVGIMNIMLVSVSERTREIGLRKAVGARPSAVLLQFLVEAVVLCLMGGLIGLGSGQGLVEIMKRIPNAQLEKAQIPLWAVGLALGFSASVGVVFGMFPAVKAARLDPIEALRHE